MVLCGDCKHFDHTWLWINRDRQPDLRMGEEKRYGRCLIGIDRSDYWACGRSPESDHANKCRNFHEYINNGIWQQRV